MRIAWLFGGGANSGSTPAPVVMSVSGDAGLESRQDAVPPPVGRRDRALDGGDQVLANCLCEKILHGWLQNRHQTLYPLTINLRQLDPGQKSTLAEWTAVARLAAREQGSAGSGRLADTRQWLASVGADADTLAALDRALSEPPPLNQVVAAVIDRGLAPHAYVAALVALDPGDPATGPFLDYAAARLGLPTMVVRSATRRYRR